MEGMESSELTTIVNQVRSDVDPAGQSRRINIYREIVTVGPGMSVNAAVRRVNNCQPIAGLQVPDSLHPCWYRCHGVTDYQWIMLPLQDTSESAWDLERSDKHSPCNTYKGSWTKDLGNFSGRNRLRNR